MADRIDGDLVELCIAAKCHAVDARKAYANLIAEAERRGAERERTSCAEVLSGEAATLRAQAEQARALLSNGVVARELIRQAQQIEELEQAIRARASQEADRNER